MILNSICLVVLGEAKASYVQKKMEITMERRMSRGVENQKSGKPFYLLSLPDFLRASSANSQGGPKGWRAGVCGVGLFQQPRSLSPSGLWHRHTDSSTQQPAQMKTAPSVCLIDLWLLPFAADAICPPYCARLARPADDHSKHFITEHLNLWPACHISVSPAAWKHTSEFVDLFITWWGASSVDGEDQG